MFRVLAMGLEPLDTVSRQYGGNTCTGVDESSIDLSSTGASFCESGVRAQQGSTEGSWTPQLPENQR